MFWLDVLEQESATLATAIPLLVIEGDNETGPGQQFAYESACRGASDGVTWAVTAA
jgi:hypothetical protein